MTGELQAATWIAAPPGAVWRVLADLAAYPQWNPYITEVVGALYEGERLRVRLQPVGARTTTVRAHLRCVIPGQELRWRSGLPLRGLFDSEYLLQLQALGHGTRFVQRQQFTGPLVPVLLPSLRDGIQGGFEAMNAALRTRVEQFALPEAS